MDASDIAKQLGALGGKKNVEKHGKEHMKKISRLGVEARKRNKAKNENKPK